MVYHSGVGFEVLKMKAYDALSPPKRIDALRVRNPVIEFVLRLPSCGNGSKGADWDLRARMRARTSRLTDCSCSIFEFGRTFLRTALLFC